MTDSISFAPTWLSPLWFIAFLPIIAVLVYLLTKKKNNTVFAPHIQRALNIQNQQSVSIVLVLLAVSWFVSVIALAGPSLYTQKVPVVENESARIIVMNMDSSMYGTDLVPNRLTRARYKLIDLLPSLKEGHTGMVAYAEHAYLVSPLTKDSSTLKSLIESLSPDIMPDQGNNAFEGVKKALEILGQANYQKGDILLVSDTLNPSDAQAITQLLNQSQGHWRLSVFAPATEKPSPIILSNGSMKTNNLGIPVMAGSDLSALQTLAHNNNGLFKQISSNDGDIKAISAFLQPQTDSSDMRTSEDSSQIEVPINQGFWLLPVLLVLALGLFRKGLVFGLIILFTISPLLPSGQSYAQEEITPQVENPTEPERLSLFSRYFKNSARQGVEAFNKGFYNLAGNKFEDPAWKGLSELKAGDYQQAIKTLTPLTDKASRFNLGSAQVHAQQLQDALQTYQSLVDDYPDDEQAKKHLEMVKALIEQQKQQDQENKEDQQEDSSENNSDKQNQDGSGQNGDSGQQDGSDQQDSSDQQDASDQQNDLDEKEQESSDKQNDSGSESQPENQDGKDDNNSSDQGDSDQNSPETDGSEEDQNEEENENSQEQSDQEQLADQEKSNQEQGNQEPSAEQEPTDEQAQAVMPGGDFNTEESDERLMRLQQIPDETQNLLQQQMLYEARVRENKRP